MRSALSVEARHSPRCQYKSSETIAAGSAQPPADRFPTGGVLAAFYSCGAPALPRGLKVQEEGHVCAGHAGVDKVVTVREVGDANLFADMWAGA